MATQKDLDRGMKIDDKALVEVEWLDACAHMNVEKLNMSKLLDFLCPTRTMGRIVAQDKKVLCVATNISNANGIDLVAIPIRWIEKVKIMEC
ncbi:MAG: hypothetical protein ABII01_04415 [Candidatus Woesearchaeota archaeon]